MPPYLLLKKTLLLALPFVIIVGLAIVTYYNHQVAAVENSASQMNEYASHDLHLTLEQILRNIKGDARLLASHPLLPKVLTSPRGSDAQLLTEQWLAFFTQKRIYDQLRLLDLHGQEILRINLSADGAQVAPREQLQNKVGRYYFSEAMTIPAGEIYFSPLDLNVENKQIEQPIKPMLRIGLPIIDDKGNKAGLIILNYLAANIMQEINAHSVLAGGQSLLLNSQGYYLHGLHKEREWLFMYPERDQSEGKFSTDYPEVWRNIKRIRNGQLTTEQGIFCYQWISTDEKGVSPGPYTRQFVLILMISAEYLAKLRRPYRNAVWAALLLVLPIILLISAIASGFRLREQDAFERLRGIEANQRLILESVGEGIFGIDTNGRLTFVNSRAAELTGYRQSEMLGRPLHHLIYACNEKHADHGADRCQLQQCLNQGISHCKGNDTFLRKSGDTFPVEYISNPIIKNGKLYGGVVSFFDITARKQAEDHIEYLALNDPLTDLPNKSLLIDRLAQQLAIARSNGLMAALLYIDIDHFKQINDVMGYDSGDEVLIEVAHRLKSIAQAGDTIARISSDEFVLLLPTDAVDAEQMAHSAQLTADEVMLILEQPFRLDGDSVRITTSIGIAIFPIADEDAATILSQADTAASNAKNAGRHTTRFFKMEMERATKEWQLIHSRMLTALAHDSFTLVYQPKVEQSGKLVGLEALLRWHDELLGQVSPADFVPVAEQSGLIKQLGEFVLTCVCQQIKQWCDAGLAYAFDHVAINISPEQFSDKDFVDYVLGHIERAGIVAHRLELEITEGTLVEDVDTTCEKVHALRERGIRFSIDDFGTGYSSLAYLRQLPLDRLKIDRSFVTGVDKDPDRQCIVEAIILLARGLTIEVIAEGVEVQEELDILINAGCHKFQGNYFYRPMSSMEISQLLRQQISELTSLPTALPPTKGVR